MGMMLTCRYIGGRYMPTRRHGAGRGYNVGKASVDRAGRSGGPSCMGVRRSLCPRFSTFTFTITACSGYGGRFPHYRRACQRRKESVASLLSRPFFPHPYLIHHHTNIIPVMLLTHVFKVPDVYLELPFIQKKEE